MNLGRIVARTMPMLRRQAESQMLDTVRIYKVTRQWNEETLTEDMVEVNTYIGPGKIQFFDAAHEQTAIAGAHTHVIARSFLHLPANAQGAAVDHRVVVTTAALTPGLVGPVWRLTNDPTKTSATALRIPIEEVLQ